MDDTLTDVLPAVRCSIELKDRLRRIAAGSIAPDLAAHIRLAVEQYVEANRLGTEQHRLSAEAVGALYALAPELSKALGKPVATLDEVAAALVKHWQFSKKESYGAALN